MEAQTLKDLISFVVFGAGAPFLAYKLVEAIKAQWPEATYLSKTVCGIVIAVAIAWAFYGFGVAMKYYPQPTDWRSWAEILGAVALPVVALAQGGHAVIVTRAAVKAEMAAKKARAEQAEKKARG